ncbi:MAG: DUF1194 domain-containing protein [Hyphomicrobiales bacterium]|nr:DUF1194 domain-containing protein [Hyphomicrobiales bacterium]
MAGGTGRAGNTAAVDLLLVLAVDVSHSVDALEARLQRDGYLWALTHPRVLDAIGAGPLGRVAVAYVEFAGPAHQRDIVGWTVIDGPDGAAAFVAALARRPIGRGPYTAIGAVLDHGRALIAASGMVAARAVIDVSGDGPSNSGPPVARARDAAVAAGITVNGLPVTGTRPDPAGGYSAFVTHHYVHNVIGGPGAFTVEAAGYEDFAAALLEKLLREIRGPADEVAGRN